jgi:hypothetical protein
VFAANSRCEGRSILLRRPQGFNKEQDLIDLREAALGYNDLMKLDAILSAIDDEINKLQQARSMLIATAPSPRKKRAGRPKGSKPAATAAPAKKRVLSAEARKRIAAGQKKRWAAAKKSTKSR